MLLSLLSLYAYCGALRDGRNKGWFSYGAEIIPSLLLRGKGLPVGLETDYLGRVSEFAAVLGMIAAAYKQSEVSLGRMVRLMQDTPPETLVEHGPVYIRGDYPEVPYVCKADRHRLGSMALTGFAYKYPDSGRGVEDIDLCLKRGTFTVVTGRVGAGL